MTAFFSGNRRKEKNCRHPFTALSISALVITGILFLVGLPVYDGLVNRPLTKVAQQASIKTLKTVVLCFWKPEAVQV